MTVSLQSYNLFALLPGGGNSLVHNNLTNNNGALSFKEARPNRIIL